jgi:hypothetical protein
MKDMKVVSLAMFPVGGGVVFCVFCVESEGIVVGKRRSVKGVEEKRAR